MTGRLPNPELAVIDQAKITAYLFASSHPAGSAKAAFFSRFGFDPTAWQVLRDALIDHARHASPLATANSGRSIRWTARYLRRTAGSLKFALFGSSERARGRLAS